jgi:heme/copper-type cytochrome/quinol oxidase subunit 4
VTSQSSAQSSASGSYRTLSRTWLFLALATFASWAAAERTSRAELATLAVILIAAAKARMIVVYFMEVGRDAGPWRWFFAAWLAAVVLLLLTAYLIAE